MTRNDSKVSLKFKWRSCNRPFDYSPSFAVAIRFQSQYRRLNCTYRRPKRRRFFPAQIASTFRECFPSLVMRLASRDYLVGKWAPVMIRPNSIQQVDASRAVVSSPRRVVPLSVCAPLWHTTGPSQFLPSTGVLLPGANPHSFYCNTLSASFLIQQKKMIFFIKLINSNTMYNKLCNLFNNGILKNFLNRPTMFYRMRILCLRLNKAYGQLLEVHVQGGPKNEYPVLFLG